MKNIAAYINKETTSQAGGYIMGVTDAITMDDNYNFIGAWPGKYRDSTQGIGDFDDFQYRCFDSIPSDLASATTPKWSTCSRAGRFLGKDSLESLKTDLDAIAFNHEFKWSDELAISAGKFVEDVGNCPALAEQVWNPPAKRSYIDDVATYKNWHQSIIYPQRFPWNENVEIALDFLLDDYHPLHPNREAFLSGMYDQIGIACNCHPTFGQWCVVELGWEVKPLYESQQRQEKLIELEYDLNLQSKRNLQEEDEDDNSLHFLYPQFNTDPNSCRAEFTSQYCSDYGWNDSDLDRTLVGTTQEISVDIFDRINEMRSNTTAFLSSYYYYLNKYAVKEISSWGVEVLPEFVWSESMSRAARHVLNDQGACMTKGSHYGEYFKEVLDKYYAYEYSDLEVMELTSAHFAGKISDMTDFGDGNFGDPATSGYTSLNYILSQDWISKNLLVSSRALSLGVACSCAQDDGNLDIPKNTCIFAFASSIKGRDIKERLPIWQALMRDEDVCTDKCPYKSWTFKDTGSETLVDHLPSFYTDVDDCANEDEFVDHSHFCSSCDDLLTFCTDCEHRRFQEFLGVCKTCMVSQGQYHGHLFKSNVYIESSSDVPNLKYCHLMDCIEIIDNTHPNDCAVNQCWGSGSEFFEMRAGNATSFTQARYFNLFDYKCYEKCEDIGENKNWVSPSSGSSCICDWRYFQKSDGSCFDCSEIDPDCITCSSETTCTACNTDNNMLVDNKCIPKIDNCDVPKWKQPDELVSYTDPVTSNTYLTCSSCNKGFVFDPTNQYTCSACDSFKRLEHCTECFNSTRCVDCELNWYPNYQQTGCDREIRNCMLNHGQYNNNRDNWVCQECKPGYFTDSTICSQCPDSLPNCAECFNATTCTVCDNPNTHILAEDKLGCIPHMAHCAQDPETYRIEKGKYVCDNCKKDPTTGAARLFDLASETCMTCQEIHGANCLSCSNFDECEKCDSENGWDLSPNHETCIQIVVSDGCAQDNWNDYLIIEDGDDLVYQCGECEEGKYLDETYTCVGCDTIDSDCVRCENGLECKKCVDELNLSPWKMECLPKIQKCTGAKEDDQPNGLEESDDDDFYYCETCNDGFYWDSTTFNCEPCGMDEWCELCESAGVCTKCLVEEDEDEKLLENGGGSCREYFTLEECPKITPSMQPDKLKVDDDGNWYCPYCEDHFYFDNVDMSCRACSEIENCLHCDGSVCTKCSGNFFINDEGKCESPDIPNCLRINPYNGEVCDLCDTYFEVSQDKKECISCDSVGVYGCSRCSVDDQNRADNCTACSKGIYLFEGQCYLPDKCTAIDFQQVTMNSREAFCTDCLSGHALNSTGHCAPCNQDNHPSWNGCTNCQFLEYFNPNDPEETGLDVVTDCTACAANKQLVPIVGDHSQCKWVKPENCLSLIANSYVCDECKDGFYFSSDNECLPCQEIEGCTNCVAKTLNDGNVVEDCIECDDPYVLAFYRKDQSQGVPRTVCDWEPRVRSRFCVYSDLDDVENCLQCEDHYFFNTDKKCQHCSTEMDGCVDCMTEDDGRGFGECVQCAFDWEMMAGENMCWQPHCEVWSETEDDWCTQCSEGWLHQWDTELCVEECDDWIYEIDTDESICMRKCDYPRLYNDRQNSSNCLQCNDGPLAINRCETCRTTDQSQNIACEECNWPFRPSPDGLSCILLNCATVSLADVEWCSNCEEGFYHAWDTGICHAECPEGYVAYDDEFICGEICEDNQFVAPSDKVCNDCDWSIEGSTKCSYEWPLTSDIFADECEDGLNISYDRKSCTICDISEFVDQDGECAPCSSWIPGCGRCSFPDATNTQTLMCWECLGDLQFLATETGIQNNCGCPDAMFTDRTDPSDSETSYCNYCSARLSNCLICSPQGDQCNLCDSNYFVDQDGLCTSHPCRSFDDQGLCTECNSHPAFTYKTQYDTCVPFCKAPFVQNSIYSCSIECGQGQFADDGQCLNCPPGCKTCSDYNTCTECESNKICDLTCGGDESVHDYDGENKCVAECSALNAYETSVTKVGYNTPYCAYCKKDCINCQPGVGRERGPHCEECQNNTWTPKMFAHHSGCVNTCPDRFYENGPKPHCSLCGVDCINCLNTDTCIQCDTGFIIEDGDCVPACNRGSYYDENEECIPCDVDCEACSFELLTETLTCDVCKDGFFTTPDGDCTTSCKDSGYVQLDHKRCGLTCPELEGVDFNDDNICKICTVNGCDSCFFSAFSSIEVCTSCESPRFIKQDLRVNPPTQCVLFEECKGEYSPLREFDNDLGRQRTACKKCQGYWDLNEATPTCIPCTYNYCKWCSWDFSNIIDPGYTCLECAAGAVFDPVVNDCRAECNGNNEYISNRPLGQLGIMTPTCVSECPAGQSPDANDNNVCKYCDVENCETCIISTGKPQCQACKANWFVLDGVCVPHCPSDQGDDSTGVCVPCASNEMNTRNNICEPCSSIDGDCITCYTRLSETSSIPLCTSCSDGMRVNGDGNECLTNDCHSSVPFRSADGSTCVAFCEHGEGLLNGQCSACPISDCNSCEFSQFGAQCTECNEFSDNPFLSVAGICVDSCPGPINGRKCSSCPSTCKDQYSCRVGAGSSVECTECPLDILLVQGNCISKCSGGTFYKDFECQACGSNCYNCNEDTCDTCELDAMLYQESAECFFACPYQTFNIQTGTDLVDSCVDCHSSCGSCMGTSLEDCTDCLPGQFLHSDLLILGMEIGATYEEYKENYPVKGECIRLCEPGSGPLGRVCIACPADCETCAGGVCLECRAGYVKSLDGTCKVDCFNTIPGCKSCSNTVICDQCNQGYELDGDQECSPKCQKDEFIDKSQDAFHCIKCNEECETCNAFTGFCETCLAEFPRTSGFGMSINKHGQCVKMACPDNCEKCDWNRYTKQMECIACYHDSTNGQFRVDTQGICVSTDCGRSQVENWDGTCTACGSQCDQCDLDSCITCPETLTFLLTADDECSEVCPTGYTPNKDNICMPCQDGCIDCLTETIDGVDTAVCVRCAIGKFLYQFEGCTDECPDGTYKDTLLNWCVKCDCGCETCTEERTHCSTCRPGSFIEEGTNHCIQHPGVLPYAVMNDDWQSFDFTYPSKEIYVGYRSTFTDIEVPVITCQDEILKEDWNDPSFAGELAIIEEIILDKLSEEHERVYLESFLLSGTNFDITKYAHDLELTANRVKVLFFVADSLFGRDTHADENISINALTNDPTPPPSEGCDALFESTTPDLDTLLGTGRSCEYLVDPAALTSSTTVRVTMDSSAEYFAGMELTLKDIFYPERDSFGFVPSPIKSIPIIVEPNTLVKKIIDLQFSVNPHISDNPIANCDTDLYVVWTGTTGLCGKTRVQIQIETVMDYSGNKVTTLDTSIDNFNSQVKTNLESFDTSNPEFVVDGELIIDFEGYLIEVSLVIENCYPDKEHGRVLVKVMDSSITYSNTDGDVVVHPACAEARRHLVQTDVRCELEEEVQGEFKFVKDLPECLMQESEISAEKDQRVKLMAKRDEKIVYELFKPVEASIKCICDLGALRQSSVEEIQNSDFETYTFCTHGVKPTFSTTVDENSLVTVHMRGPTGQGLGKCSILAGSASPDFYAVQYGGPHHHVRSVDEVKLRVEFFNHGDFVSESELIEVSESLIDLSSKVNVFPTLSENGLITVSPYNEVIISPGSLKMDRDYRFEITRVLKSDPSKIASREIILSTQIASHELSLFLTPNEPTADDELTLTLIGESNMKCETPMKRISMLKHKLYKEKFHMSPGAHYITIMCIDEEGSPIEKSIQVNVRASDNTNLPVWMSNEDSSKSPDNCLRLNRFRDALNQNEISFLVNQCVKASEAFSEMINPMADSRPKPIQQTPIISILDDLMSQFPNSFTNQNLEQYLGMKEVQHRHPTFDNVFQIPEAQQDIAEIQNLMAHLQPKQRDNHQDLLSSIFESQKTNLMMNQKLSFIDQEESMNAQRMSQSGMSLDMNEMQLTIGPIECPGTLVVTTTTRPAKHCSGVSANSPELEVNVQCISQFGDMAQIESLTVEIEVHSDQGNVLSVGNDGCQGASTGKFVRGDAKSEDSHFAVLILIAFVMVLFAAIAIQQTKKPEEAAEQRRSEEAENEQQQTCQIYLLTGDFGVIEDREQQYYCQCLNLIIELHKLLSSLNCHKTQFKNRRSITLDLSD